MEKTSDYFYYIEKTETYRYDVMNERHIGSHRLRSGTFYIDDNNFVFFVITAFGNWRFIGSSWKVKNFKKHLADSLMTDSFLEELEEHSGGKEINVEETKNIILSDIIEFRKQLQVTKKQARTFWNEVCFWANICHDSYDIFKYELMKTANYAAFYPDHDIPVGKIHPENLVVAQKVLFPPLQDILTKEIENEDKPIEKNKG